MKQSLTICCLVLCVGLSISTVSSEFHSFFFHSNETCPHSEQSTPCSSHGDEEEKEGDEGSSCPVLLFTKSSQVSHIPAFLLEPTLSIVDVFHEERERVWSCGKIISVWARGPPLRV